MPPYDPYFRRRLYQLLLLWPFPRLDADQAERHRPEVAFNLAVPTFFALTVSHAFGVGYHLYQGHE